MKSDSYTLQQKACRMLLNSYLKKDDYDFTKENEWRYIPYRKDINGNYISIDLSKYEENQTMHNEKIEDYPLKFEIIDIKKIFVASHSEIKSLSESINIDKCLIQVSNWKTE